MKVGVHQGSALSQLLFIMVMDFTIKCEGWFINGVVAWRRSCFVWEIIKMRLWKNMGDGKLQCKERV